MKEEFKVIVFFVVLFAVMTIVGEIDQALDKAFYGTEVQIEKN